MMCLNLCISGIRVHKTLLITVWLLLSLKAMQGKNHLLYLLNHLSQSENTSVGLFLCYTSNLSCSFTTVNDYCLSALLLSFQHPPLSPPMSSTMHHCCCYQMPDEPLSLKTKSLFQICM